VWGEEALTCRESICFTRSLIWQGGGGTKKERKSTYQSEQRSKPLVPGRTGKGKTTSAGLLIPLQYEEGKKKRGPVDLDAKRIQKDISPFLDPDTSGKKRERKNEQRPGSARKKRVAGFCEQKGSPVTATSVYWQREKKTATASYLYI